MLNRQKENKNATSVIFTGNTARKIATYICILFLAMTLCGCSLTGGPRPRMGYLATGTIGIAFPSPDKLGNHSYGFNPFEQGGIVYTCKAGHIDIDHIRGNADNVRYLIKKNRKVLTKQSKGYTFSLAGDPAKHVIRFTYPQGWENDPNQAQKIEDIAFCVAPYVSYQVTLWHEIETWFGVHFVGFEQEFNSAFSWEDTYSNLVGTQLGAEAVRDTEHDYNQAMTMALNRRLKELDVQPRETTVLASRKVRGEWFTGNFTPDVKMRNFDIGLDGFVTPTQVPDIEGCDCEAVSLPVPTLDVLKKHGLTMTYQVKPFVFEQGKMYKAAGSKKLYPEVHFPIMLEYIKKDAVKRGYKYQE